MGPGLLLLQEAVYHWDSLQRLWQGDAGRLYRDWPLPAHVGGEGVLRFHKTLCHALGRLSQLPGLLTSSGIWHTFPSSQKTCDTSLVRTMLPSPLSCLATANLLPFLDTKALSAAEAACSATAALASDRRFHVIKRLLAGVDHPLIPLEILQPAFDALHALSQPGVCGSRRLLASWFLWPGMNKVSGLRVAWIARRWRWPDMCARCSAALICLPATFHTSRSTRWAPCCRFSASFMSSPSWTILCVGPPPTRPGYFCHCQLPSCKISDQNVEKNQSYETFYWGLNFAEDFN